jgi:hypothetical protein
MSKHSMGLGFPWGFSGRQMKTEVAHAISRTKDKTSNPTVGLWHCQSCPCYKWLTLKRVHCSVCSKDSVIMPLPGGLCRGI